MAGENEDIEMPSTKVPPLPTASARKVAIEVEAKTKSKIEKV